MQAASFHVVPTKSVVLQCNEPVLLNAIIACKYVVMSEQWFRIERQQGTVHASQAGFSTYRGI